MRVQRNWLTRNKIVIFDGEKAYIYRRHGTLAKWYTKKNHTTYYHGFAVIGEHSWKILFFMNYRRSSGPKLISYIDGKRVGFCNRERLYYRGKVSFPFPQGNIKIDALVLNSTTSNGKTLWLHQTTLDPEEVNINDEDAGKLLKAGYSIEEIAHLGGVTNEIT